MDARQSACAAGRAEVHSSMTRTGSVWFGMFVRTRRSLSAAIQKVRTSAPVHLQNSEGQVVLRGLRLVDYLPTNHERVVLSVLKNCSSNPPTLRWPEGDWCVPSWTKSSGW